MFPVRCFTCNKVVGRYEEKYNKMVKEGQEKDKVLDQIGMKRYCCRRMFLCHVDLMDSLLKYNTNQDKINT